MTLIIPTDSLVSSRLEAKLTKPDIRPNITLDLISILPNKHASVILIPQYLSNSQQTTYTKHPFSDVVSLQVPTINLTKLNHLSRKLIYEINLLLKTSNN